MTCTGPNPEEAKRLKEQRHSDIQPFATRITHGLIYQFQDQIPFLLSESRNVFIETLTKLVFEYVGNFSVFFDALRVTVFDILMSSSNHFINPIFPFLSLQLKTFKGYEVPLTSLFSLGTRTLYGGKYEPQRSNAKNALDEWKSLNFPPYRRGTCQVNAYPQRNSKDNVCLKLTPIEPEAAGTSTEEVFWKEADKLAQQFLDLQELAALPSF